MKHWLLRWWGPLAHIVGENSSRFGQDLTVYIQEKLVWFGRRFEVHKGNLVSLLMAKRGRYQGSFLNVSVFVLVASGIIAAPHISSYYPTLGAGEVLSSVAPPSASVADLNSEEMSMATQEGERGRDQVVGYTVQTGDTLSSIADKFGVSHDTIKWANSLQGSNPILKPGQTLQIPPVTGVMHKVKRGETVYSIAKKYDVDPQKILNYPFNDFVDLDTFALEVGQTLVVPDGVIAEPSAPAVTRPPAPQYIARQGGGKLLFPTNGTITQNPVWYHRALDIANRAAPDVYAAESGTATLVTCLKWGYGCHIILTHVDGTQTLYGHLQAFYISQGQKVERGQAIGRMGSTGRSTGTHLHFEVRIGGHPVSPWPYLK